MAEGRRAWLMVTYSLPTLDYAAGNRILAERTITGTTLYLYGHDCLGEYTDHWLYYLPDASGYVRQGTDSQGQVVSTWTYDPDGTVLVGPKGLVSRVVQFCHPFPSTPFRVRASSAKRRDSFTQDGDASLRST
jgi:hypothetical protein